ncbi:MAG: alpha-2-macroglobulin family protein, partial [Pseudomonadota bacterium]
PDGVVFSKTVRKDQGLGGRTQAIRVPSDAMRGTWRIAVHLDPKAAPIAETAVLVEDFLPERLALDLETKAEAFVYGDTTPVAVTGRYLYGPPAADLAVEADVLITAASGATPSGPHAGYYFGDTGKFVQPTRASLSNAGRTDEAGKATLLAKLPKLLKTARPLTAKLMVRLREPGGRTIERAIARPVIAGLDRIGIKPSFAGNRLAEGQRAEFEVIAVDGRDARTGGQPLRWQIVRLERIWQWYRRDGVWSYDSAVIPQRVATGEITSSATDIASIAADLKPGRYRLDVAAANTSQGAMPAKLTFNVGWYQNADADSPEVLDVALDRESYVPGATANVRVATTEGGHATIAVISDGLKAIQTVDIEPGMTTIPIRVGDDWGAGAYVTVALHRPMDVANRRMPTRAIGLAWLKTDQAKYRLQVSLETPERMRSAQRLSVPVKIAGLSANSEARVTVAAIDEGILSVTRFKTPDPAARFFAQTRLAAEIRDVYGRLIDGMRAERGTLRHGGDAAGLN